MYLLGGGENGLGGKGRVKVRDPKFPCGTWHRFVSCEWLRGEMSVNLANNNLNELQSNSNSTPVHDSTTVLLRTHRKLRSFLQYKLNL